MYRVNDWPAMSLFAQVCWGTLFTKIFGFSFTVLRISTLVIAACGVYAFWVILKELNVIPVYRKLATGVIVFNPLFFHLSNSFMTDVPFLSVCIIASLFYLKFIREERLIWWCLALFFSVFAILIRQLGLFVPLAFLGAMVFNVLVKYPVKKKFHLRTVFCYILTVFLTYVSLRGYTYFLDQTTGIPKMFSQVESIVDRLSFPYVFSSLKEFSGVFLIYIGVFLLPILIIRFRSNNKWFYIFFTLALLIFTLLIENSWNRIPLGNIISNVGLGTISLPDILRKLTEPTLLPQWTLWALKISAFTGALLLLGHLSNGLSRLCSSISKLTADQVFKLGVLFFISAYTFFLIIDYYRFDRYLLPLIPFLIILILPSQKVNSRSLKLSPNNSNQRFFYNMIRKFRQQLNMGLWVSWSLLFIMAYYSVIGTHDYLAWNKARWKALSFIESQGVLSDKIDGGFEYNGWHQTSHQNPSNPFSKSWWFIDEDDYAVAFEPYHNYESFASFPYQKLLVNSVDTIHALKRPVWASVDTFFYDMEPISFYEKRNNLYMKPLLEDMTHKDSLSFSGQYLFNLSENTEYAFSHTFYPVKPFEQFSISMYIKGSKTSFGIVSQAPEIKDFNYTHTPFLVEKIEGGWQLITAEMKIPKDFPSDTLKLYLWKPERKALQVDDFKIIWRCY